MAEIYLYPILLFGAMFAGFIDAVVGGGGLVQVPLLFILFPELSHVQIIATNRLASVAGTFVSAYNYFKAVGIEAAIVTVAGMASAISSYAGTHIMPMISKATFTPILILVISILTIYTYFNKNIGLQQILKYDAKSKLWICIGIGTILGLYNGIIGPGTGTLLVFALVMLLGLNFIKASGNAKVINAIADSGSLIGFIINHQVIFKIALPMMVFNMAGSYLGSKTAISKGNQFIRKIFLLVMFLLILRLIASY